mgnify:CR=1 FL=1
MGMEPEFGGFSGETGMEDDEVGGLVADSALDWKDDARTGFAKYAERLGFFDSVALESEFEKLKKSQRAELLQKLQSFEAQVDGEHKRIAALLRDVH